MWATEVVHYTLDGTNTSSGGNSNYAQTGNDVVQNNMNWSITGNTTINPWRIGGKVDSGTASVDREAYSKTAMGSAITKVELVIGDINLSSVNSIKLVVASNSNFSTVIDEITKSPVPPATSIAANQTLTFQPTSPSTNWATGAYYKLVFNVTLGTSNKYIQVKSVKFYKEQSGDAVSTPTFDPVGGTYTSAQNVEIKCGTAGATIHYTTNGSDPTESDATYSSEISVTTSGTVIKAKAFKSGMTASTVASATYTIKPNQPTITATGTTITISGDEGCTFYYTTNGDAPDNTKTKYTAPFDLDANCTIKAKAYDAYGNASDMKSLNFKYMPLNPKNIGSGYYEIVTDANSLENGDAILIVYETGEKAMSTTQNTNNRGQTAIEFLTSGVIYAPSASVQKLVLVKKTEKIGDDDTDVFYFYTGSGYLYAASGSSNHLKTEATPDDNNNARATVSISSGDATILFTGTNDRKWLKYNSTSSLFSCYKTDDSDQSIVQIYKEVAHNESATVSAAEYATFCNATYALDFSETGITVYTATDNETSVSLNEITSGKVPANTPVVLYKAGANGTPVNVPVIASAEAVGDNDLRVSTGTDVDYMYVLANGSTGVGFYPWGGTNLSAGKVYLQAKASYGARAFLGFNDDVTAIEAVKAQNVVKGEYFNLAGQRVAQPNKGLYIVNGKKVVNK